MWNEVQSCLVWPGNKVAYLLSGNEYVRFNIEKNRVDPEYPLPIEGNWWGLWSTGGRGIMWPGDAYVYFFRDSEYMRFNIQANHVDIGYPRRIVDYWPGFSLRRVDSGLVWPNGKAYFIGQYGSAFGGETGYTRYNIVDDREDQGPQPLLPNWRNLNIPPGATISAATVWPGNEVAYLFSGTQYWRYDIVNDITDKEYPKPIAGNWEGVPIP
jgi:hypothetical protein